MLAAPVGATYITGAINCQSLLTLARATRHYWALLPFVSSNY